MAALPVLFVPFREDQIEAVCDAEGNPHVVIRRICENLGVAFQPQLKKLQDSHWATVTLIVTVAQDGKQRELAVLPLRQLPMWLARIDVRRVAGHAVEKLKLYQLEAVDVLYHHFLTPRPAAALPADPILAMLQAVMTVRQAQLDQGRRLDVVETNVGGLIDVAEQTFDRVVAVDGKVDAVLARQRSPGGALPAPGQVPGLTTRDAVRVLVNRYVKEHGSDHATCYHDLWEAAYYRLHYNAKARAEHSGRSKLAQAEYDGRIAEVYALACELFDLDRGTPGYNPG